MDDRNISHLISGGMAAAAFVAVTQIVTRDELDCSLQTAVTIFALTIPVLIYLWIDPLLNKERTNRAGFKHSLDIVLFILANLLCSVSS
jgi:hypothetical protein